MLTTIQRWGNSLAVRIPKPFAAQTDLSENSQVDISLDGDRTVQP
jgi:antitoxin MazE